MSFASDNHSGVHPEVLERILKSNPGYAKAYGDDPHTDSAVRLLQGHFGPEARIHLVFNGTAANVLGLKAVLKPHESILCAQSAHIHVDECGAPEAQIGCKLIPLATPDGKLTPSLLEPHLIRKGDPHFSQPRVISISQTTEYGTLYSPEEIHALSRFAKSHQLFLHLDGARISNAAAALGLGLKEITRDLGVDVLSLGGTKNGILAGEAVVFLNPSLGADFAYLRKQGMQLSSKMRFLSAQFEALFENDLWLRNARHANAMAALLETEVRKVPGLILTQRRDANALFALLPKAMIPELQKKHLFYTWRENAAPGMDEVRWMTSFQTTPEEVRAFAASLQATYLQA